MSVQQLLLAKVDPGALDPRHSSIGVGSRQQVVVVLVVVAKLPTVAAIAVVVC